MYNKMEMRKNDVTGEQTFDQGEKRSVNTT